MLFVENVVSLARKLKIFIHIINLKTQRTMTKGDGIALAAAFLGGAIAGAAVGLLFAPEKGEDQRAKLRKHSKSVESSWTRKALTNSLMRSRVLARRKRPFLLRTLMPSRSVDF